MRSNKIIYGYLVPAASTLPDRLLRWLHRKLPVLEADDGWSFWMDASYCKYCRVEQRKLRRRGR